MVAIYITDRAALEIDGIEKYSRKQWGKRVADEYINNIEKALELLKEAPGLLLPKPDFSKHLKFYSTGKRTLVFEVIGDYIYLVTIKYSGMNLEERMTELEPTLRKEVEIMHFRVLELKK